MTIKRINKKKKRKEREKKKTDKQDQKEIKATSTFRFVFLTDGLYFAIRDDRSVLDSYEFSDFPHMTWM